MRFRKWAGLQDNKCEKYYFLSVEELQLLAENVLVEIGAHTMSHTTLSILDNIQQKKEIENSKLILESIINKKIISFSYPFGNRKHFTNETIKIVKETGFQCGCTTIPGVVFKKTDPFMLPRFVVRDWDGDEFEKQILSFLKYK